MQLACLVVGGLPLVRRPKAILYFSFLSLQVGNSYNCHFSCRAVYLALEQIVSFCPWPVFTVIEFLDFFIFELLSLLFHSVIFICHPTFLPGHWCSVWVYVLGAVQCTVQWMKNTKVHKLLGFTFYKVRFKLPSLLQQFVPASEASVSFIVQGCIPGSLLSRCSQ